MKYFKTKLIIVFVIILLISFTGCSLNIKNKYQSQKMLVFGTTLSTKSLDPADNYCGWFTVRYGVTETLFKLNDNMEPISWLADGYELIDENTWKITLRKDVYFHNGKIMDSQAVKKSLERTLSNNARAENALKINEIKAYDGYIIINTYEKNPTLINDLCDPFASIIDVDENIDYKLCPIGTGPFMVDDFQGAKTSYFVKNPNYYSEESKLDVIKVIPVTDSDTLLMAFKSGEIDAAQGLSYTAVSLLEDENEYKVSSKDTSRVVMIYYNFNNEVLKNKNIRKAINMLIDKKTYCEYLLSGCASEAYGPFPSAVDLESLKFEEYEYNLGEAINLLNTEGYYDTDNDGYLDKDGKKLSFNLVTYSARAELPTAAQAFQNSLKNAGIDVKIEISSAIMEKLDSKKFDMVLYSNVTNSSGDKSKYLSYIGAENGASNYGSYINKNNDELLLQLNSEFDTEKRKELESKIMNNILSDDAYSFIAYLKMSFAMKENVAGLKVHETDYYQFDNQTDIR